MAKLYWRPIVQSDPSSRADARRLGNSSVYFTHFEVLSRTEPARTATFDEAPEHILQALSAPRPPICGMDMGVTRLMGILNVTPDSFSDGGDFSDHDRAVERARHMMTEGADIIDIGGESTRPGAEHVSVDEEAARVLPVIETLAKNKDVPISIDTRKAEVARRAIAAGAGFFNDVSALSFDAESLSTAAHLSVPVCLMHASGDPKTMQSKLNYSNVLLDVFDYLEERRDAALAEGITLGNIALDPGIGFGKTTDQNIELVRGLSLFHTLGCSLLVGASRKRFIGEISGTNLAKDRMSGSLAVALDAVRQGVQLLRVHDVNETRRALDVWRRIHN